MVAGGVVRQHARTPYKVPLRQAPASRAAGSVNQGGLSVGRVAARSSAPLGVRRDYGSGILDLLVPNA